MRNIIASSHRSQAYTEDDHMDWVDKFNFGVSHKGIPSECWNISSLVDDNSHDWGNYVKLQFWHGCQLLEGNFDAVDKCSSSLL